MNVFLFVPRLLLFYSFSTADSPSCSELQFQPGGRMGRTLKGKYYCCAYHQYCGGILLCMPGSF